MKKIYITIIALLLTGFIYSQEYFNYTTEQEFKNYFKEHINELDPIEGIWRCLQKFYKGSGLGDYTETFVIVKEKTGNYRTYIKNNEKYTLYIRDFTSTSSKSNYISEPFYILGEDFGWKTFTSYFKITNNSFNIELRVQSEKSGEISLFCNETYLKTYPDSEVISDFFKKRENPSGTGFALSSNGYIVTNYHVIENATKIKVKGVNNDFNKSYNAIVVLEDKTNDLAILSVGTTFLNIPYTISNKTSEVGTSIFCLGYPLRATMGDEVKLTNGIISSKTGFQGDVTSYQISAPVQPGNSGGPLFDNDGNLIGIVSAKHIGAENVSYAIKTSYLFNLIDLMNTTPKLQTINSLKGKSLSEQVKLVKNFTYIIEVN